MNNKNKIVFLVTVALFPIIINTPYINMIEERNISYILYIIYDILLQIIGKNGYFIIFIIYITQHIPFLSCKWKTLLNYIIIINLIVLSDAITYFMIKIPDIYYYNIMFTILSHFISPLYILQGSIAIYTITIAYYVIKKGKQRILYMKKTQENNKKQFFDHAIHPINIENTHVYDDISISKIHKIEKENKKIKHCIKDKDIISWKNYLNQVSCVIKNPSHKIQYDNEKHIEKNKKKLIESLKDFHINGEIHSTYTGPVVTVYEFEPHPGIKISKIINLSEDIARVLKAYSSRISIKHGTNFLEIEIPNNTRRVVYLGQLLHSKEYTDSTYSIPLCLGTNVLGEPFIESLSHMPHVLIAGTTGSGKSVGINAMILSIITRLSPKDCRIVLIDPKMLEFTLYNDIPHLLCPVITEVKKAVNTLHFLVKEMEKRYEQMARLKVRNIEAYNRKTHNKIPFIVCVIDEFADLMIMANKEIDIYIQRLAQMARAAGIHLIIATQRPSVDIITGTIKANFPVRIAYQLSSKIDSRTIIDQQGAEKLLGKGDFLFSKNGKVIRGHAPLVSEKEIEKITKLLEKVNTPTQRYANVNKENESIGNTSVTHNKSLESDDVLFNEAMNIIMKSNKVSISYLQRSLRIGYNRAANIVEKMERDNIISPPNHTGKRTILIKTTK